MKSIRVGVVGAGKISDIYLENMTRRHKELDVQSICARTLSHAQEKAAAYGLRACVFEEMLSDPEIDMIVNLTPVGEHYGILRAALEAGKHAFTEKTLTDDLARAAELVELAREKNLYLGAAPDTFLGASLQTARRAIDEGWIGEATSFSAAANRNANVLLSLFPFTRKPGAGILFDYGVYYVTALVSLLGPAAEAAGYIDTPYPIAKNVVPGTEDYGAEFENPNETRVSAILKFQSGITGTLHLDCNTVLADQANFVIYGTKGMLLLGDPNAFGGTVRYIPDVLDRSKPVEIIPLEPVNEYTEDSRGLGPADLAAAILSGGKARASGELAYHVQDILTAIARSAESHGFAAIRSHCARPEAFLSRT